jgi:hypothetical protein
MWEPGAFQRQLPVAKRAWKTPIGQDGVSGLPTLLTEDADVPETAADALRLMTMDDNGRLNATIYNLGDRFRGRIQPVDATVW